jgi:hypothetical protein
LLAISGTLAALELQPLDLRRELIARQSQLWQCLILINLQN